MSVVVIIYSFRVSSIFTRDLAAITIPRLEAWKVKVIMNNRNDLNGQSYTTWLMANFDKRKDCRPVKENIRTWIPPIAAGTQHLDHRDEYAPPA